MDRGHFDVRQMIDMKTKSLLEYDRDRQMIIKDYVNRTFEDSGVARVKIDAGQHHKGSNQQWN